jgi:hypothetical protein
VTEAKKTLLLWKLANPLIKPFIMDISQYYRYLKTFLKAGIGHMMSLILKPDDDNANE